MNYIELINNFWRLNKEHSFTPNEKAVYFALLNKCNELGWKNPFNQSNGYLAMDSGMSEPAMTKARNTLKQKNLIDFKAGDGRRINTIYSIIISKKGKTSLYLSDTLSHTLSDTLSHTLSDENGLDNNKLKTKQNKSKEDEGGPSPPTNEFLNISDCKIRYLKIQIAAIEQICMSKKITPERVVEFIDEFNRHLLSEGTEYKVYSDYTKHFSRWLNKQNIYNGNKQNNGSSKAEFNWDVA
jgi:DNA-binding MarR family transcriptional regulator